MDAREDPVVITLDGLRVLVDRLRADGRVVIGPTVRDGVVVLGEITGPADLPAGVGDEQGPGRYRSRPRADAALFARGAPADSWKRLFFPARERLLADPAPDEPEPAPVALLGVQPCDLAALLRHDRVLAGRRAVDVRYARRRRGALVVAVSCTTPAGTCSCDVRGTGPDPGPGYDVWLAELLDGAGHRFVAAAGTDAGRAVLAAVPSRPADGADLAAREQSSRAAAARLAALRTGVQGGPGALDPVAVRDAVYAAVDSPRWEAVAARCLACANCTLVCPTCFCTTVEDTCDLTGTRRERLRLWDSCFTADFSHLHGGSVRASTAARYRQWLTHKLAAWTDQFGEGGCVGCGRCTTWCPAGIDLLAEEAALAGPGGDR